MDLWLKSIGLGHHIPTFAAQKVGLADRAHLSEEDLKELGLTIGERSRWRRAIAALPGAALSGADSAADFHAGETMPERRPLTMMFVDMINSSGLAERLEPEDLLALIDAYCGHCDRIINHYGGHIARIVGDGLLAYFCYPIATENDPERAVRAALDITRSIDQVRPADNSSIGVRIGIATGRVIISDLLAGEIKDKASIIGAAPNLASRLQALAPANGVVVAEETYARISGRFAFEPLGDQSLRGFGHPVTAWLVKSELQPSASAAGDHPSRLTPLFGRQPELLFLKERWNLAKKGNGSVVLLTGEPGIGKTRLVENFVELYIDPSVKVFRVLGSAFTQDTPFGPCIEHTRRTAGIAPDDPVAVKLEKLDSLLLGDEKERAAVLPLMAQLLDIPIPAEQRVVLSPERLRAKTLAAMMHQLQRHADVEPVCLLIEDLHWLDPSTHELLDLLAADVSTRRMFIVLTARDSFSKEWSGRPNTATLGLLRLDAENVFGMLTSIFKEAQLPETLLEEIALKTDGVPLFIEEVARTLLQRRDDLAGRASWGTELAAELIGAVPASLRESFMGRLDRSGTAKRVAQVAAVCGRSIRLDVLSQVSDLNDADLHACLDRLIQLGIMHHQGADETESYTFNHALLRDASYDSLLRDRRVQLHRQVAQALGDLGIANRDQQPETLAYHLSEAGELRRAADYWLEAGRRSVERSALLEASRLLGRGVAGMKALPDTPDNIDTRLQLLRLLGPVLIGLKGPGSPDAQDLYRDCYDLCTSLPEHETHFPFYWGWWRVSRDFHAQLDRSAVLMNRARARKNSEFMLQAHHCNWASHYHAGEFAKCCEHIKGGLALYEQGDYRHHAAIYGNHDPKVCALGEAAQLMWMVGRTRTALREEHRSVSWARSLNHLGSRVHAMDFSLLHRFYRRDWESVARHAEELIAFTSDAGLNDHRSKGLIFRGWAMATRDQAEQGLRFMTEGLDRQRDTGLPEDFPIYHCMLAEAFIAAGRPEKAYESLVEAQGTFETLGLRVWMPEVLRMAAESLLSIGDSNVERADVLLDDAAAIAERQEAWLLAMRVEETRARIDAKLQRYVGSEARLDAAIRRVAEPEESQIASAVALLKSIPKTHERFCDAP